MADADRDTPSDATAPDGGGSDDSPSDAAAPDDTGSDDTGSDDAGSEQKKAGETGCDEKGSDEAESGPNLIDRTADRIDAIQRRIPPVAVIHGVLKKYGEDRGGQLAMLLAYRGFFSLFPLLLAFVAVIGLLLDGDPEMRDRLIDSTLAEVPIVGSEIAGNAGFTGSLIVVIGSVLLSIWAGLGLLEVLQETLNTVWAVPMHERPPWILRRLRSLGGAVLVGACLVLSGAGSWLVRADSALVQDVVGWLLPFTAGVACYLGLHWLLCVKKVPFVSQLPGAAFMGVSWLGMHLLGAWYVDRFVLRSSDTYGVFVLVFGLLSWVYLIGMLYVYANELASVLHERRWPRSLTGRNLTDADRAAVHAVLHRELRVEGVEVDLQVPRLPR